MSKPVLYRQFLKRVSEEYALARCWQRYAFRKGQRQHAGWGARTGTEASLTLRRALATHCFCHCSQRQCCPFPPAFDSVNIP